MIIKRSVMYNEDYTPTELKNKFKYCVFVKAGNRYIAIVSNLPIDNRGFCIIRESRRLSSYEQRMNSVLNDKGEDEIQRTYRVDLESVKEDVVDSHLYEVYEMLGG